jgi:LysR family transcriptional regulator of abg operon
MNTKELHYFVSTAEQGGVRAAARALGVPQPAVTRAIQSLERQLKVALLIRRSDGMTLSAEGKRFLTRARLITNEAQKAAEEIQQTKASYVGEVHAVLSIMPHLHLFPTAIRAFTATYPKVKLHIREALLPAVVNDLRSGEVDFYMGAISPQAREPDIKITELMANSRIVVGRREHPLRHASSLDALTTEQWAVTDLDHDASAELQTLFQRNGLPPPEVSVYGKTTMSILMALTNTNLLAMLPEQWAANPITRDLLAVFPISEKLPALPIGMAVSSRLPLTPPAEHFSDLLRRGIR